MKRVTVWIGVLLPFALAFASVNASAQTTFNMTGTIVNGTCQWTLSGGSDSTVALDPISVSALPAVGATGYKPFQLTVNSCSAGLTQATFAFTGTSDATDLARYKNTGAATGVAVELESADGATIGANNTNNTRTVPISAGQATLDLRVAYWKLPSVLATTGSVLSSTLVTMSYL
ncbi:fimbrial protein [Dyella amyloliquefaciens]|uniref:fimbrial protein n=1 Tax=Dyella amyloliquefaciens TaxID=1770545 RepID=UPI00102E92FD|nr:fimbrial protein [Dyella amyloliquefaciens]